MRGHAPPLHTQIYIILHNVSTNFLFLLFQVGIVGRFCAVNASKIRAALRRPSLQTVRRHSATLSKVAFYIQTLFSGKGCFYFVRGRGMGGCRVPFDTVGAYFFALRICTHIFFNGICGPRIGRGATCSHGVFCARPRGLVRAYPTRFLPLFHDCTAAVMPGLSKQLGALHASAPQYRRDTAQYKKALPPTATLELSTSIYRVMRLGESFTIFFLGKTSIWLKDPPS